MTNTEIRVEPLKQPPAESLHAAHTRETGQPSDAASVLSLLKHKGLTIATAESLTGGALCARMIDVAGASAVVRGGVCAYATDVKVSVLGVDAGLLDTRGTVDAQVACDMAQGARRLIGTDLALSTTGVAGPRPSEGYPAGTVYIALAHPAGVEYALLHLSGTRAQVRSASVDAALTLLYDFLTSQHVDHSL